jgi:hypothetical protein
MAKTGDILEQALDIPDVIDQVGYNDVVKLLVQIELVDVGVDELDAWMLVPGQLDVGFREVDAYPSFGLKSSQEVAISRPEFDNCRPRRDHETVDLGQSFVVVVGGISVLVPDLLVPKVLPPRLIPKVCHVGVSGHRIGWHQ